MIINNGTHTHRVDTCRDYRRIGRIERFAREIRRAVRLFMLRGDLACIKAERETYMRACGRGVRLGPNYLANSEREQRRIEGLISFIETRLDY